MRKEFKMSQNQFDRIIKLLDEARKTPLIKIEARSSASTPRERAALTSAINGLTHFAQSLSQAHRKSKGE